MLIITGGGGFIGSVLAAQLNDAGRFDLVIVDRFGTGDKWRNIAKRDFYEIVPPDATFEWLDGSATRSRPCSPRRDLGDDLRRRRRDDPQQPQLYIALWRWCAAKRKKFIYASSAATYGDGSAGFDDAGGIAALKRLRPLNLYGWSKHAFDLWAMRQAEAGNAPPLWAGLKFFNVFGPNEHHKGDMTSLVVKNYPRIMAGETISLFRSYRPEYADGEQLRDFVYVKDCAAAMLWLWRHEPDDAPETPISGIYNLGSGQARSFLDLMHALGAACGVAPKIEFIDMPESIRPNYQYFTQAEHDPAAPRRLQRPVHPARRRRARLRDAISVAARPVSLGAQPQQAPHPVPLPASGEREPGSDNLYCRQHRAFKCCDNSPSPRLRGEGRGEGLVAYQNRCGRAAPGGTIREPTGRTRRCRMKNGSGHGRRRRRRPRAWSASAM